VATPSISASSPNARLARRFEFAAVLFDVDGTLIDSNAAHADAWEKALREHGFAVTADEIRPLIGMGSDKLLPEVAHVEEASAAGRELSRRKKELFAERLPSLEPTRGVRALVEFLIDRGVDLIIATSAGDDEMNALLERAGVVDLIPKRTSKDDASSSKPDPDIVYAALAKSRHPRERTIMIGDTPYDIEAARRAGIATVALRCGGYWRDDDLRDAVAIFDDPAALLGWWQPGAP
jgi:HAD superfamily hydrolase (TIGR01549 family)